MQRVSPSKRPDLLYPAAVAESETLIRVEGLGKTYGNLMVDLLDTSAKLRERAKRVLMTVTGVDYDTAATTLAAADGHVKTALVMLLAEVDAADARARLERADGFVRRALEAE